jgi:hypothetical protein
MTEEDVARLFKQASDLGYKYDIDLLGAECVVAAKGYEEDDYRISDSEHILHELAHCVLLGVSFGGREEWLLKRLATAMSALSQQEQCMNEIEVFSVVMEVMRRNNIEFEEQDYLVQLPIQLGGFEPPEGFDTERHVRTFHATERGRAAVETIMKMMEEA